MEAVLKEVSVMPHQKIGQDYTVLDIGHHTTSNYVKLLHTAQAVRILAATVQKIIHVIFLPAAVTKDVLQDTSYL